MHNRLAVFMTPTFYIDLGFGLWALGSGLWALGFGLLALGFWLWAFGFLFDSGPCRIIPPFISGGIVAETSRAAVSHARHLPVCLCAALARSEADRRTSSVLLP